MNVGLIALITWACFAGACFFLTWMYRWCFSSSGDNHPLRLIKLYLLHFKQFWAPSIWIDGLFTAMCIVPVLWLVCVVHEGSHAVFALINSGDKPFLFAPFPVDAGGPVFGVTFGLGGGIEAAPQFVQLGVLTLLTPFFFFRLPTSLHVILRTYFLCTTGGLVWNTGFVTQNDTADWPRFQVAYGLSDMQLYFVTLAMWIVPASHFLWVSFVPAGRLPTEPHNLSLFKTHSSAPSVMSFVGLAVISSILALAYIITAVTTPTKGLLDKDKLVFRLPLTLGAASLLSSLCFLVWAAIHRRSDAPRAGAASPYSSSSGRGQNRALLGDYGEV